MSRLGYFFPKKKKKTLDAHLFFMNIQKFILIAFGSFTYCIDQISLCACSCTVKDKPFSIQLSIIDLISMNGIYLLFLTKSCIFLLFCRHAASSRLTWWTCCANRAARGPSRRKRSSEWCRSSTGSSTPSKSSWNRAPAKLSWYSGRGF